MDARWMEGPSPFLALKTVPSTIRNETEVKKNKCVKPQGKKLKTTGSFDNGF